jgi:N-acetylglutamate synthase-like GNAT family acetyltransferase
MIRECKLNEIDQIYHIINNAAEKYRGAIPDDCFHEPYMSFDELQREFRRVTFYGWEETNELKGVMGMEKIKDVTLVRHAYVLTNTQKSGIGSRLIKYIEEKTATPLLLVGTWAAAVWAIKFYRKHGFTLLEEKDRILQTYWDLPYRQIETSIVMGKQINSR